MSSLGSSERYILYGVIEEIRRDYPDSNMEISIESIRDYMSGRGLDMNYNVIRKILENVKILKDDEDVNVFTRQRGPVKTGYVASTEDWDLFYMLLRLRTRR